MENLVESDGQGEKEPPDPGGAGGVQRFGIWTGPKEVFDRVKLWGAQKFDEKHIGTFLQYCFAFAESLEEEDELVVWMLELITKFLEEHGGWSNLDQTLESRDWSSLALSHHWAVLPPQWARDREVADIEEEDRLKEENVLKENSVKMAESVAKKDDIEEENDFK